MVSTVEFVGGETGIWRVTRTQTPAGDGLPYSARLSINHLGCPSETPLCTAASVAWRLRGTVSNLRYTTRGEADCLGAVQPSLDRPTATRAALIPIKKSPSWWGLAQDERRAIFEETSHHTRIGLGYLPAVARRLHHCRDLGEPFDFLTWFEFAPEHESAFEALVAALRATHEWTFVEREVDIRLTRVAAN
ncbi:MULTISPECIES: chlorite dismutase family protein [unclassified Methylobacterium]|uniref:chlorite dismutase family protein n=1 Tax=unclassified Methylobacterium TaxID=2615210 RepID=UPI000478C9B3|nr:MULTISPECIES: chlorite dismutase family protein [unclassified Methylobacterium]SEG66566.1 Chlorite dismutase [Methylobacterium sp. 190mf]